MGPGRPIPYHLPDETFPMRAKKNTRYVTAGVDYQLNVWRRHGLILIQFVDRRSKIRTLCYHNKNALLEEWEAL